jgi:hypothetical protein
MRDFEISFGVTFEQIPKPAIPKSKNVIHDKELF